MFNTPIDTIRIGYPMSEPRLNLAAYHSLGNRCWTSNFGLRTQYNVHTPGYDPLVYALAQGVGSPNHISNWNPMLLGIVDFSSYNQTNPVLTQGGQQLAYNEGYRIALQYRLQDSVAKFSNVISKIQSLMKSDMFDESQKERLQVLVDELQARQKEVQQRLASGKLSTEEIAEIARGNAELLKVSGEELKEICEEAKASASEGSDDDSSSDGDSASGTDVSKAGKEAEDKLKKQKEKYKNEAVNICQNIYDGAIGCVGTDYDKIGAGVNAITKDNVTTFLQTWQEQFQPQSGDANVIETIFDEEMFWNNSTNTGMIAKIVKKLDERAQELGIKNELAGFFATAYDELDDFNVNETAVQNAVMTICQKVMEAEAEADAKVIKDAKAEASKQASEKRKTERENKQNEKIAERKAEFAKDLKEITGDENAQVSDAVKFEGGRFKIRVMGKDYTGRSYLDLAKALEKDGHDPVKYLKKSSVALAA